MTKILDLRAACRALGEISGKKQKVNGAVNRDLGEIVENTQNVNWAVNRDLGEIVEKKQNIKVDLPGLPPL